MNDTEVKLKIESSLHRFSTGKLDDNAIQLFKSLGYESEKRPLADSFSPGEFVSEYCNYRPFNVDKAMVAQWKSVHFLFQLTGDEISSVSQLRMTFSNNKKVDNTIIESYIFFAIDLSGSNYSRTMLANITREINKQFPMPVMVLFRHGSTLTLSIINRRLHKLDQSKDVLEKVTLIKDIKVSEPHRAHIEILADLSLVNMFDKFGFTNFVELHNGWQKVLDSSELNKKFFAEIANWYFWALQNVNFPKATREDKGIRNATSVIRLITRLIFVWFIKEKDLIPEDLFIKRKLSRILKNSDPRESAYYKAILQNLFFATLNQEMNTVDKPENRKFRSKNSQSGGRDPHYNITNLYRYEDYFVNPHEALNLFSKVPFLNGGLFECLDKPDKSDPSVLVRIDGFSDRDDNEISVPDFLFFSEEQEIDLNEVYGTENRQYTVRGLINIFNRYKFTIDENTPIEQEVALDPELLGKVFENLLANYNPETSVTARKQTGSYYTPREIVNYMIEESLISYLDTQLKNQIPTLNKMDSLPELLREVLAYTEQNHPFNEKEVSVLINAIDNIKIIDPACGSGAFPMGVLHKLVFILSKLDSHNELWKKRQLAKASEIPDVTQRENLISSIEEAFERNELDYGRKLYLIENCIFGIDIQPIAVQISKLRFFISLVVDQRINESRPNRGIIPLPNLETKFVAANTLIRLDRPSQLTLRNPSIDIKEKELEEVRKQHFSARTLQRKRACRLKDAQLRADISVLLQRDGLPRTTTEKLAQWDPYDHNASADFFDPEWMFGISHGFDVVIANPPYIDSEGMVNGGQGDIRDTIQRTYTMTKGNWDIYIAFFEFGFKIMSDNGTLTFITPDKWIAKPFGDALRIGTIGNMFAVLKAGRDIFESSNVDSVISFFSKKHHDKLNIYEFEEKEIVFKREVDKDILESPFAFDFLFSNHIDLLLKIASAGNKMANLGVCENACATSDAYKLSPLISDCEDNFRPNTQLKIINTGTIGKYFLKWGKREMTYLGNRYLCPIVEREEFFDTFSNSYAKKSIQPKIIIKGLNLLDSCLDEKGEVIPGKTTLMIANKNISTLKLILAILNCKLAFFYLKERYPAASYNQGTSFTTEMIDNLPIPIMTDEEKKFFIDTINNILAITTSDDYQENQEKTFRVKDYQLQIDEQVFKLYKLSEKEKEVVENV